MEKCFDKEKMYSEYNLILFRNPSLAKISRELLNYGYSYRGVHEYLDEISTTYRKYPTKIDYINQELLRGVRLEAIEYELHSHMIYNRNPSLRVLTTKFLNVGYSHKLIIEFLDNVNKLYARYPFNKDYINMRLLQEAFFCTIEQEIKCLHVDIIDVLRLIT